MLSEPNFAASMANLIDITTCLLGDFVLRRLIPQAATQA
jgi:hypothetical protein